MLKMNELPSQPAWPVAKKNFGLKPNKPDRFFETATSFTDGQGETALLKACNREFTAEGWFQAEQTTKLKSIPES